VKTWYSALDGGTPPRRQCWIMRCGKGVVAVHAATYTFAGLRTQGHEYDKSELIEPVWKEYQKLVGGHWDLSPPTTGHAGRKVFTVKFSNPSHPITRGLQPFRIGDEQHTIPLI
jgi:type 1 glutamine amidotransferase